MRFSIVPILIILLSACATKTIVEPTNDAGELQTFVYETAIESGNKTTKVDVSTATANAPLATNPPTKTFTPSSTPTNAFTPTNSPTPIPLGLFNPFTFVDGLRTSPNGYLGSYIRALSSVSDGPLLDLTNPIWLAPSDYRPRGIYVNSEIDASADNTVAWLKNSEWVWIYGVFKETRNNYPLLSVIHVESISDDQLPKNDGVYRVNVDIAPGQWKSMSDATETQSCYWARIASDGSIIDNFFGYGGTIVYISDSDFAVEFKNCSIMVYLRN